MKAIVDSLKDYASPECATYGTGIAIAGDRRSRLDSFDYVKRERLRCCSDLHQVLTQLPT